MIKANELRIGNKLQKENGEAYTVSRIDNTQDVLVEEQRGLLTLNYNLFGITLTPEILEKCGFVKVKNRLELRCVNQGNESTINSTFSCYPLTLEVYGARTPIWNIKYFHQLQNLYFALTGEELIYKNEN